MKVGGLHFEYKMVKAIQELKAQNDLDWKTFPRGKGSISDAYCTHIMAKNGAYNEALSIIAKYRRDKN